MERIKFPNVQATIASRKSESLKSSGKQRPKGGGRPHEGQFPHNGARRSKRPVKYLLGLPTAPLISFLLDFPLYTLREAGLVFARVRSSLFFSSLPLSLSFTLSLFLFSTESSNQAADNELACDGGWLFAFLNHSRGGRYKESRRYTAGMRIDVDYPGKHLRDFAFTRL